MRKSWRYTSTHTAFCKARFNGLIRADKIASGHRTPKALGPEPATPIAAPPAPAIEAPAEAERMPEVGEEVGFEGVALDHLPFSAGIPPAEEAGMIGKISTEIDHDFQESDKLRGHGRRASTEPGKNSLFEYACSDDSIIGQKAEQCGVRCVRLSRTVLDLEQVADVNQATGQLESMPGADVWTSLTCTYHSPLQHLNEAIHGREYSKKLRKARKRTMKMLDLAIPFLNAPSRIVDALLLNGPEVIAFGKPKPG